MKKGEMPPIKTFPRKQNKQTVLLHEEKHVLLSYAKDKGTNESPRGGCRLFSLDTTDIGGYRSLVCRKKIAQVISCRVVEDQ